MLSYRAVYPAPATFSTVGRHVAVPTYSYASTVVCDPAAAVVPFEVIRPASKPVGAPRDVEGGAAGLARTQAADRYRHDAQQHEMERRNYNDDVVWVSKRHSPTDTRSLAPVRRHKLVLRPGSETVTPDPHWVKPSRAGFARYVRDFSAYEPHLSRVDTRCAQWSTLREMLPTRNVDSKFTQPNWGADGPGQSKNMTSAGSGKHFPIIASPMTRFVGHMLTNNRQFMLY